MEEIKTTQYSSLAKWLILCKIQNLWFYSAVVLNSTLVLLFPCPRKAAKPFMIITPKVELIHSSNGFLGMIKPFMEQIGSI